MKPDKKWGFILVITLILAACSTPNDNGSGSASFGQGGTAAAFANQNAALETNDSALPPSSTNSNVTTHNGVQVGFNEDGRPYKGDPQAPIVIEEFSDFQCPFCNRFFQETLPSLLANQIANGEAMIVFYDFPLSSIHPQAVDAANAARCAGEQGPDAYWEMHDALFYNESQWANNRNANAVFISFASQIGLNQELFTACQEGQTYYQQIQDDYSHGLSRGVSSTPSFFVNNQPLIGAQPISVFNSVIARVQAGEPVAVQESADPSTESAQPSAKPTPAAIDMTNVAATMGDPNAPVTIVEFTDYQCPFCQRHSTETLPTLVKNMVDSGRVFYVMKDFPLDNLHPDARAAATAVRCAGEQESYWQMHDAVFQAQSTWAGQGLAANDIFSDLAASLSLDGTTFEECMGSGRYDGVIQSNLDEGISLGVRGTPFFFIDGFPINGAQEYDLFELAVGYAEEGTLADAYTRPDPQPEPTTPAGPIDVPLDSIAYAIGSPEAPVTIVEYTDFQCPFCARHFNQTFPSIKENFVDTGQVRYVFKDFPLTSIHPQAMAAAQAARCAGEQNGYMEMHDTLFRNQDSWANNPGAVDIFISLAEQVGLDTEAFATCLTSGKFETAVRGNLDEGTRFGIRGTPTFFINGNLLSGAQPYNVFVQAVNQASVQTE